MGGVSITSGSLCECVGSLSDLCCLTANIKPTELFFKLLIHQIHLKFFRLAANHHMLYLLFPKVKNCFLKSMQH